jgi:hypothetical protein
MNVFGGHTVMMPLVINAERHALNRATCADVQLQARKPCQKGNCDWLYVLVPSLRLLLVNDE